MHFGVDYYPEHWDAELMAEDIARIGAMGADMVRIGEFAWHLMEPTEGAYDFTFFDGVLEELREGGLVAMFGTPTATFPAWLAAAHPEILGAGPDGLPRVFGGRRQYCYNSPVYRDYCTRIVTALVSHYADERTIVSWQIDNEFGHEGSDDCYCANCQVAWRDWLAAKYDGIDDLNRRWGTIFWGQTYNGFDEVPCPLPTITTHSPSLKLDWARFRSDSLNDFARSQIALVRSLKGPHQSVTTNLCGGFFGKLFDHRTNVADLDFVSYDNYPVWGGLVEPMEPAEIAMTLDFVRGLRRANFWIVEQLMGAQGHDVIGYLPRPKQAQMWAYQAFGHGCESMLWFRWRGMTRGAEQYCLGVIDHDNSTGRKYHEVADAIADLRPHEELFRSEVKAEVAVVYDMDSVWAWRAQTQSVSFDYTSELMRLYRPFHALNVTIDVLPVGAEFADHKVVVLPVPVVMDQELAGRLGDFVRGGGTLLLSFRAGTKDRDNTIPFGLTAPGLLRELCGISISEGESLPAEAGGVAITDDHLRVGREVGRVTVWRDLIRADDAEVLYRFTDQFYGDCAAVTRRGVGAGAVYYIGGGVDAAVMAGIGRRIAAEAGLEVIDAPAGLEVVRRRGPAGEMDVVTNHTDRPLTYAGVEFGPYDAKVLPVS